MSYSIPSKMAAMISSPSMPSAICFDTEPAIFTLVSSRSTSPSSQPGMSWTRYPPAAKHILSRSTRTPRAHTVGVCSLEAKYSVTSSAISPLTMGETPT